MKVKFICSISNDGIIGPGDTYELAKALRDIADSIENCTDLPDELGIAWGMVVNDDGNKPRQGFVCIPKSKTSYVVKEYIVGQIAGDEHEEVDNKPLEEISNGDMFVCDNCGEKFLSGWSSEEAIAEYERRFGHSPAPNSRVVCEECHKVLVQKHNASNN
ncbi:hypothetical protein [Nitrospira sp. BLG_1]|uniref:hypothetical protein n=1 Tax=Nitrospira sp. BLG_1 TaxID=3395883 RepID=UPI0039BC3BB7